MEARSKSLGIDLPAHEKAGRIVVRQIDPAEVPPGQLTHQVRQAVENDVHIVGASSLAAGHLTLVPALKAELTKLGREDIMIAVGGVIPKQDYDELYRAGASCIFGPGTVLTEAAKKLMQDLSQRIEAGT